MLRKNKVVYLVEGETEKKFIKSKLSNAKNLSGLICNGPIHIFNPFNEKTINKIRRHLEKSKSIVLIIDMDVKENDLYKKNIRNLSKECKKLIILKQNDNFEDEMVYITFSTHQKLYNAFNACSNTEFKSKYLSTQTLIVDKFPQADLSKYCSRDEKSKDKIKEVLYFQDIVEKR